MPYATPADLIARYDANDICQLCSDDKRAVSVVDLPNNYVCLTALNGASGDIDTSLLVGNRYTPADLATLSPNSTYKLIDICCDIAAARLTKRRLNWNPEKAKIIREESEVHLERLRKGENSFGIQQSLDAGEPVVDGPSVIDYSSNGLLRDRVKNFFPPRFLPKTVPPGV